MTLPACHLRPAPLVLLLALLLAGCTAWPPPGRGGMAEHHAPAFPAPPDAFAERLACELTRMEDLRTEAAQQGVLTGRFALAQGSAARVQREYAAGLLADAARSLPALSGQTTDLSRTMPPGSRLPPECP
jgi:hypothetical protein